MEDRKTGHVVYFISAGCWLKVGYSSNFHARMEGMQTSNPLSLALIHTIEYGNRPLALTGERQWRRFINCGAKDARGEWLKLQRDAESVVVPIPEWMSAQERLLTEALARNGFRLNQPSALARQKIRGHALMPILKKDLGAGLTQKMLRQRESNELHNSD
jgi:hypothetical protein